MKYIKKTNQYKAFIFACLILSFAVDAKSADKKESSPINQESLSFISFQSGFGSYVAAAQQRILPKKFGSEINLSGSAALKGVTYLNSGSVDASYRFYILKRLSLEAKYSFFQHAINAEGSEFLDQHRGVPLEIKHAPRQAFYIGLNWYPIYGKISVFNTIFHFDGYISGLIGNVDLANTKEGEINDLSDVLALNQSTEEKKSLYEDMNLFPSAYLGGGFVVWCTKRINLRGELGGRYYQFELTGSEEKFQSLAAVASVSMGIVF